MHLFLYIIFYNLIASKKVTTKCFVDCDHKDCDTILSCMWLLIFLRKVLPPPSGCHCEDGGSMFLQNVDNHLEEHMTSQL
jgi:hypothetical protein